MANFQLIPHCFGENNAELELLSSQSKHHLWRFSVNLVSNLHSTFFPKKNYIVMTSLT